MQILKIEERLPKKAGEVEISYSDEVRDPVLKDREIMVPLAFGIEIYPVCNETQVVIKTREKTKAGNRCYFGGTDNSPEKTPFLTEIMPYKFLVFEQKGEDAFYESLIPDQIWFFSHHPGNKFQKQLFDSEELQKHPNIIRRQGDIFAVPVPYDGEEVEMLMTMIGNDADTGCEFGEFKAMRLFSTRHTFKGGCITGKNFIIGEGTLLAPDHLPITLRGKMHLIMRAEGLADQD